MDRVFSLQQTGYREQTYLPVEQRKRCIARIKSWLQINAERVALAIAEDFGHRSHDETKLLEIYPLVQGAKYHLKHIDSWVKPRKRHMSWQMKPAKCFLQPNPKGVVGIIVPWNYPLFLALSPLFAAVAAGNRVMIKMSEYSQTLGNLLSSMLSECQIGESHVAIVNGGVDVAKAFTQLPWDHLLFTGATSIGKEVMRAASQNLTPVTLELGGKSPTILDDLIDDKMLTRILMAKLFNAGQTCVAPDYLMIPEGMEAKVETKLKKILTKHYPKFSDNPDYSCIINTRHLERLAHYIDDAAEKGATVVALGERQGNGSKLLPHLIFDVNDHMEVMQHEIFGPILPILVYRDFAQVLERIKSKPKPLALYYFGKNKAHIERLKLETSSGALVINDAMMHVAIDDLPFGGIGFSGMGAYHGVEGFNTFSHLKPILCQSRFSQLSVIYPPYGKITRLFLKWVGGVR